MSDKWEHWYNLALGVASMVKEMKVDNEEMMLSVEEEFQGGLVRMYGASG